MERSLVQLTQDESEALWKLSKNVVPLLDRSRLFDSSQFLPDIPGRLRTALAEFREGASNSGYLLVKHGSCSSDHGWSLRACRRWWQACAAA